MNNIEENHVILVDIGNTRIKYSLLCHAEEEPNACEDANSLVLNLYPSIQQSQKIPPSHVV